MNHFAGKQIKPYALTSTAYFIAFIFFKIILLMSFNIFEYYNITHLADALAPGRAAALPVTATGQGRHTIIIAVGVVLLYYYYYCV